MQLKSSDVEEKLPFRSLVVVLVHGMVCGLPLALVGAALKGQMTDAGLAYAEIGALSLISLPYSLKMLWAPLFDLIPFPVLGRRRGWATVVQVCCALSVIGMGGPDPLEQTSTLVGLAVLTAFFSASQDIVLDSYRREVLSEQFLGLGNSLYTTGYNGSYRFIGQALVFFLVGQGSWSWSQTYQLLGVSLLCLTVVTLFAPREQPGQVRGLGDAIIGPFKQFFSRSDAILVMAFLLLYKIGDAMAASMTITFLIKQGISKTDIGLVAKTVGFGSLVVGGLLGGTLMIKLGLKRSLFWFGLFQAITTAFFVLLIYDQSRTSLGLVTGLENFATGMGTTAFVTYLMRQVHRDYTATQMSLLTAMMSFSRDVLTSPAGIIVEYVGWSWFYVGCAFVALPALLFLPRLSLDHSTNAASDV